MITANLKGGLGNQMFQIAAAHAHALRNGTNSGFDLDGCYTPMQGNPSNKYKETVLCKINNVKFNYQRPTYYESSFSYSEIPDSQDLIIDGYFQSEKYFKEYKKEIKQLFNLPLTDEVLDFLKPFFLTPKQKTCVHVRRGDYLKNSNYHPVCTVEYYKKAMKAIGDSYFIFISDDMEWVKENFKGDNIYYSPFKDEVSDLKLLKSGHNVIMSNSSFSWWGAYLNECETKTIIAPKIWFGPDGPKDTQDIIPEDWIII